MAGNFRRLEFGAMWLVALAGLGVTLMTTGFRLIGLGLTVIGLLLFLHRFWGDIRRVQIVLSPGDGEEAYVKPSIEFLLALIIIPVAALIAVYIFASSGSLSQAVINGNEVSQLRRELAELREGHPYTIPPEDEVEFVEKLRSTGQIQVAINHADDEKARALTKRLITLFESSGWDVNPSDGPRVYGTLAPEVLIWMSPEYTTPSPAAGLLKALLAKQYIEARIMKFNPDQGGLHSLRIFVGPAPKSLPKQ